MFWGKYLKISLKFREDIEKIEILDLEISNLESLISKLRKEKNDLEFSYLKKIIPIKQDVLIAKTKSYKKINNKTFKELLILSNEIEGKKCYYKLVRIINLKFINQEISTTELIILITEIENRLEEIKIKFK